MRRAKPVGGGGSGRSDKADGVVEKYRILEARQLLRDWGSRVRDSMTGVLVFRSTNSGMYGLRNV